MAKDTAAKTAPEAKTDAPAKPEYSRYYAVNMTPELGPALVAKAAELKLPIGTYMAQVIAKELGVTLVAKANSKAKYAGMTPEQKKAAKEAAAKEAKEAKKTQAELLALAMERFGSQMKELQAELLKKKAA